MKPIFDFTVIDSLESEHRHITLFAFWSPGFIRRHLTLFRSSCSHFDKPPHGIICIWYLWKYNELWSAKKKTGDFPYPLQNVTAEIGQRPEQRNEMRIKRHENRSWLLVIQRSNDWFSNSVWRKRRDEESIPPGGGERHSRKHGSQCMSG